MNRKRWAGMGRGALQTEGTLAWSRDMGWECVPGWGCPVPVVLHPLGPTWPKAATCLSGRRDLNQGAGPWRGLWLTCCTPVPAPPEALLGHPFPWQKLCPSASSYLLTLSLVSSPGFSVHCVPGRRWVLTALCCTLSAGSLFCSFSGSPPRFLPS